MVQLLINSTSPASLPGPPHTILSPADAVSTNNNPSPSGSAAQGKAEPALLSRRVFQIVPCLPPPAINFNRDSLLRKAAGWAVWNAYCRFVWRHKGLFWVIYVAYVAGMAMIVLITGVFSRDIGMKVSALPLLLMLPSLTHQFCFVNSVLLYYSSKPFQFWFLVVAEAALYWGMAMSFRDLRALILIPAWISLKLAALCDALHPAIRRGQSLGLFLGGVAYGLALAALAGGFVDDVNELTWRFGVHQFSLVDLETSAAGSMMAFNLASSIVQFSRKVNPAYRGRESCINIPWPLTVREKGENAGGEASGKTGRRGSRRTSVTSLLDPSEGGRGEREENARRTSRSSIQSNSSTSLTTAAAAPGLTPLLSSHKPGTAEEEAQQAPTVGKTAGRKLTIHGRKRLEERETTTQMEVMLFEGADALDEAAVVLHSLIGRSCGERVLLQLGKWKRETVEKVRVFAWFLLLLGFSLSVAAVILLSSPSFSPPSSSAATEEGEAGSGIAATSTEDGGDEEESRRRMTGPEYAAGYASAFFGLVCISLWSLYVLSMYNVTLLREVYKSIEVLFLTLQSSILSLCLFDAFEYDARCACVVAFFIVFQVCLAGDALLPSVSKRIGVSKRTVGLVVLLLVLLHSIFLYLLYFDCIHVRSTVLLELLPEASPLSPSSPPGYGEGEREGERAAASLSLHSHKAVAVRTIAVALSRQTALIFFSLPIIVDFCWRPDELHFVTGVLVFWKGGQPPTREGEREREKKTLSSSSSPSAGQERAPVRGGGREVGVGKRETGGEMEARDGKPIEEKGRDMRETESNQVGEGR